MELSCVFDHFKQFQVNFHYKLLETKLNFIRDEITLIVLSIVRLLTYALPILIDVGRQL